MTRKMATESTLGKTVNVTQVGGRKANKMALVFSVKQMALNVKASGKMARKSNGSLMMRKCRSLVIMRELRKLR